MRILVTGGRDFRDMDLVREALLYFNQRRRIEEDMVLIEGGANGADALAHQVAQALGWQVVTFGADWHMQGKKAGPMRNQRMIDLGRPELVLAFEGGKGTADMTKKALKAGVPVTEVRRAGRQMVLVDRRLLKGVQL